MLVTQSAFSHVGELDGTFGACVHEPIAALRVELGCCDDFCQFFHIGRFDVDDVETLILNVEVPQVYPKIITANEGLPVAVDGYAVYVIGMRIGIRSARDGGNDSIMVRHARELQLRGVLDLGSPRRTAAAARTSGSQFV